MHQRVFVHLRALLLLFSLAGPLVAVPAAAPAQAPTSSASVDIADALRRGLDLEAERRWGEALSLYDELLHEYPEAHALRERYDYARLHYDLGRRYSDTSFSGSLLGMSEDEALSLYGEVLLKIQSHYVDQPDWRQLLDRGTYALEVALTDPHFVNQHGVQLEQEALERFERELRYRLASRVIQNRHEVRQAALYAARFTQQQLGVPSVAVLYEYLAGTTNLLDDYSTFLTGSQLKEIYSQIDGNFVGLGVELKSADEGLLIVRVIPGSPAEQGGLRAEDRILSVGDKSTLKLSTDAAANLLQGPEGTVADLTVMGADNQVRRVRVRRAHVDVPSIEGAKIADPEYGIAYLKLVSFQKTTSRELDTALWSLHRQGMKSLVMDLRGNPGGLLTAAVEVADKFCTDGTIVSTKGRNPREDFTYGAHRAGSWRVPLVVLIDGDSASASEIFAGAIRDLNRGTVVGERSYGKGSVQGIFSLGTGGAGIRLTTAKFYSPNGRAYSQVGVEPHVTIQKVAKPIIPGDAGTDGANVSLPAEDVDHAYDAAIQTARRQIARR